MSLSTALRVAQNSIFNASLQTSVTSRNISESGNTNYARRDVELVTTSAGATVFSVRRAENQELLRNSLAAMASSAGQASIADGAARLNNVINGTDNSTSPATFLTQFENALQLFATDPSNDLTGEQAIYAAKELANGISDASVAVQSYRTRLDSEISSGVETVNALLDKFKIANDEIVRGTATGQDVNDALDTRDTLLKEISQYISISTNTRDNNDLQIYTSEGVTLFETLPRKVSFEPTASYSPGNAGNQVYIDGVPLTSGSGASTNAIGSLAAKLQMRDDVAEQVQGQLDEIARGLIVQFAETDQSGGGGPALAGLFTYSGGPAIPGGATAVNGIALTLSVNAAFDPSVGGSADVLRDGGANGANYVQNTNGGAAFSTRLNSYIESIGQTITTDPSFGLAGSYSLSGYAQSSIGWLDGVRSTATRAAESKQALSDRLETALSSNQGVNLDEELSMLIELEQSYQASARVISTVNNMYATLLQSVG
ncbi:flagellar hook-associated protein FlgK [Ahrensia sp. 13_GOM-1096m]|uniref:flagellar hook-associated protein FlgK n=1 Tax=Ahrensia sp. 13_GOM-1096m TaxID=1380380 RepID=UPI00047A669F|nr:flagellar hook-associated protein FlgK [Ahrensia sp. 13_GOM-1096m]